jgi:hypothetical protein
MEVSGAVECPYCASSNELLIDTSISIQRFTIDCEVCCRPFQVTVEAAPGEILALGAWAG